MSMKVRETRSCVVAGFTLLALGSGPALGDVVVYDNSTTPTGEAVAGTLIGNEITLAGEARYVTRIAVALRPRGSEPATAEIRIRFFANDGADAGEGPMPSTELWRSEWIERPLEPGLTRLVEIDVPTVKVPDRFTWEFTQRGPDVELVEFHPPTVGSGRFGAWLASVAGVVPWDFVEGAPPFGARITAGTIPTVSTWGLAALWLVLLIAGTVLIRGRARCGAVLSVTRGAVCGTVTLFNRLDRSRGLERLSCQ